MQQGCQNVTQGTATASLTMTVFPIATAEFAEQIHQFSIMLLHLLAVPTPQRIYL